MLLSPLVPNSFYKIFTPLFKTLFNISRHDHLGALVQHLFLWCLNNCYCLTDLLVDLVWILCSIMMYLGMWPSYHLSLFLVVLCLPCAFKTGFPSKTSSWFYFKSLNRIIAKTIFLKMTLSILHPYVHPYHHAMCKTHPNLLSFIPELYENKNTAQSTPCNIILIKKIEYSLWLPHIFYT
jgi:hypothetical protein